MVKKWIVVTVVWALPLLAGAEHLSQHDSVGTTTKNGLTYVMHRVEQGETLYSLGRRYGVRVDDILKANPGMTRTLKIDEMVHIPLAQSHGQTSATGNSGVAFHVVKPSETLFSISKKYGITVDDLKRWNNLQSNTLSPGMKLAVSNGMGAKKAPEPAGAGDRKIHTVKQSETLFSISKQYHVTVQDVREWNHLSGNTLSVGQKLIVSAPEVAGAVEREDDKNSSMLPAGAVAGEASAAEQEEKPASAGTEPEERPAVTGGEVAAPVNATRASEENKNYEPAEKTTERGMAEVIGDASDSRKYLALHRDAPIGTIMQIKNEMNDQIVFVRVVGRIPDTGDNAKVLVKISKKAYDRLGALDKRFPVVISYVK